LRPVLERLGSVVTRVAVEVGDANGPRGGVDKYCGVSADLAGLPSVFVESIDADTGAAIDRSASRFERAVRRAVVRARERTRESARTRPAELAHEG
jgi:phage gp37-like protein